MPAIIQNLFLRFMFQQGQALLQPLFPSLESQPGIDEAAKGLQQIQPGQRPRQGP